MDDDVLRRGKPTVHVQFGDAQAMLAGDAHAGARVRGADAATDGSVAPALQARLCGLLARAAGDAGMAGGQAIDLASVGLPLDEQRAAPTCTAARPARCCSASVLMGAACGDDDAGASGRR